jgi:hypothetical protein
MNTALPDISGNYIYRSLINNPELNVDFSLLEFGQGIITLTQSEDGLIKGQLDMGSGYLMTLEGSFYENGINFYLSLVGTGIINTATSGWIYEYFGLLTPIWPNSIDQLRTFTGSTIRAVNHGEKSMAGYTATFYMVVTA